VIYVIEWYKNTVPCKIFSYPKSRVNFSLHRAYFTSVQQGYNKDITSLTCRNIQWCGKGHTVLPERRLPPKILPPLLLKSTVTTEFILLYSNGINRRSRNKISEVGGQKSGLRTYYVSRTIKIFQDQIQRSARREVSPGGK
jgi:hypothetical protein